MTDSELLEELKELGIDLETMSNREVGDVLYRLVLTRDLTLQAAMLILDQAYLRWLT